MVSIHGVNLTGKRDDSKARQAALDALRAMQGQASPQALFVAAGRALKGTPWRHRGRKTWAIDCIGLIAVAASTAGFAFEDARYYGREPWDDQLRRGMRERFGNFMPPEQGQAADVALIRWRGGEPSHVGILGDHPHGGLTIIHAHNLAGVTECRIAHPFDRVIVEVYRPCAMSFR